MCKYWVFDTAKILKEHAKDFLDEMIDDRLANPDGSGIYFYNNKRGTTFVKKFYGIAKDDVVEKALKTCIDQFTTGSLLIYHNRYSTSGEKTKSQCHPIPIDHCDENGHNIYEGWYVVHNGILSEFEIDGLNNLSDTQIVARSIGQWMYDHNIKSPLEFGDERWKEYWETLFSGSKVTIIHKDDYYTINSDLGVVEDGVWKSGSTKVTSYSSCEGYSPYGGPLTEWEKKYLKKHNQYYGDDDTGVVEVVDDKTGVVTYEPASQAIPDYDPSRKDN